jgi:hypothetical protein
MSDSLAEDRNVAEGYRRFVPGKGAGIVVACGIAPECSLTFRAIYRTHSTLSPPYPQPNKIFFNFAK